MVRLRERPAISGGECAPHEAPSPRFPPSQRRLRVLQKRAGAHFLLRRICGRGVRMTSLQVLILSTIHRHGPQTDMSLWGNTRWQSLAAITLATETMEKDQLIEKGAPSQPAYG